MRYRHLSQAIYEIRSFCNKKNSERYQKQSTCDVYELKDN